MVLIFEIIVYSGSFIMFIGSFSCILIVFLHNCVGLKLIKIIYDSVLSEILK